MLARGGPTRAERINESVSAQGRRAWSGCCCAAAPCGPPSGCGGAPPAGTFSVRARLAAVPASVPSARAGRRGLRFRFSERREALTGKRKACRLPSAHCCASRHVHGVGQLAAGARFVSCAAGCLGKEDGTSHARG